MTRMALDALTINDVDDGFLPTRLYLPNGQAVGPANPVNISLGNTLTGGNLLASQTQTASGNSADLTAPAGATQMLFLCRVSAISGTSPTVTFAVRGRATDGGKIWLAQTASITAAGGGQVPIGIGAYPSSVSAGDTPFLPPTYDLFWLIADTTPSVTFLVDMYWR